MCSGPIRAITINMGSGSITPLILNFSTRWLSVGSLTLQLYYLGKRALGTQWIERSVGTRNCQDVLEKNYTFSLRDSNPRPSSLQPSDSTKISYICINLISYTVLTVFVEHYFTTSAVATVR